MVSIILLISSSAILLGTVLVAPIPICITKTMFNSFFTFLARSKYLSIFLFCFLFFSLVVVLSVALSLSRCKPTFSKSLLFSQTIYPFRISVMFIGFPYIVPEMSCPLHLAVHLSFSFFFRFVGRIFFHYFGRFCFTCIFWFSPDVFWILLSPISFDLFLSFSLSGLSAVVSFEFFHLILSLNSFPFLSDCLRSRNFFVCPLCLRFCIYGFFRMITILTLNSFISVQIKSFSSTMLFVCCLVGCLVF